MPARELAGLQARLGELARPEPLPDGRSAPLLSDGRSELCLPLTATSELAETFGLHPAEVEAAALRLGIRPERFLRNFDTYGLDEQLRLLESRVALVGLGGLGGYVLELLARAGVGRITGADGDSFAPSNLNRQLLCTARTLDAPKARAAAERAALLCASLRFTPVERFLDEAGMDELLAGADLCIDALGGLKDRPALGRAAARAGVPLVTAAVAGQAGYVATVLPGQANPADFFGPDPAAAAENALGTPAPAVSAAAALVAGEALNILCGRKPALAGSMLLLDLARMQFETVRL